MRCSRRGTDKPDLGSVWRVRHCAAGLSAQHQRRRRVSLGRLQFRRKFFQGDDLICATLISSSPQAVRSQITEAQKIAGGSGSEQDIAEAKIELEVRDSFTPTHRNGYPDDFYAGLRELAGVTKVNAAVYTVLSCTHTEDEINFTAGLLA